ncbi:MAG TPA: hypothetical protein VML35_10480 [Gaiellaceae bacterium]|nr:hypothetical protein [Gaiellaceae bacterium]
MRFAVAVCLAACFIAAGCGGSSSAQEEPDASTLEQLWRAPGEDVAIVPGSADFGPGTVRLTFLVVDGQGRLVTRPTAKVWLARELDAVPFAETTARAEKIGVDGVEPGEAEEIFVVELELEEPGTYWVLAEPVGGEKRIQAVGNVIVQEETQAPDVGAAAPASATPTLTNATLQQLSTANEPDLELYRSSVAEALAAEEPFVVAFATPRYCTSRTCGPVVDVVSAVRERHPGLRFIHVEIYEDNDPAQGENRWVREWGLPSEPWIFVVGADGTIRERFEGTVSVRELDEAVSSLPS